jgi:hypothetical protein
MQESFRIGVRVWLRLVTQCINVGVLLLVIVVTICKWGLIAVIPFALVGLAPIIINVIFATKLNGIIGLALCLTTSIFYLVLFVLNYFDNVDMPKSVFLLWVILPISVAIMFPFWCIAVFSDWYFGKKSGRI